MNDIEEALTTTLTRRAAAVPSPIGLTAKIRQRHAEQRRRRALVTAASGVAAVTLVTGGWALVDPQLSGGSTTGISAAAAPSPSAPVEPIPDGSVQPSPAVINLPGALPWPGRGEGAEEFGDVIMDRVRAMWAETPDANVIRIGKDIAPLGRSPRLLKILYAADAPNGVVLLTQGTDETKQAMLAVFLIADGAETQENRLLSRGPVDEYRVSPSTDVLRFVVDDDVYLLTPPSATAAVSRTPVGDGATPVFTPVRLKDGLLTMPVKGAAQAQVQVRVGSRIVYQGPIAAK